VISALGIDSGGITGKPEVTQGVEKRAEQPLSI
jgi:hypothetical protein